MQSSPTHIPNFEEFKTMLRRHGLKATSQRLAVHGAMMELVHASAEMVAEKIAATSQVKITQSSVYNILSQLALHGIYRNRLSTTNKMFFDVVPTRHIHMYDREGNVWRDLVDEDLDALVNAHLKRRKFKGFTIEDIDIQLIARPTRKTKN